MQLMLHWLSGMGAQPSSLCIEVAPSVSAPRLPLPSGLLDRDLLQSRSQTIGDMRVPLLGASNV